MTSWASPIDVQTFTGKVVDQDAVDRAQGVIETLTGGRLAAYTIGIASRTAIDWLRRAVAYQAAWMVTHPDFFDRDDVVSFAQDGFSATLRADSLMLAPLARRCLKRLPYVGTRTSEVGSGDVPLPSPGWYTSDDIDDALPYTPLNGS